MAISTYVGNSQNTADGPTFFLQTQLTTRGSRGILSRNGHGKIRNKFSKWPRKLLIILQSPLIRPWKGCERGGNFILLHAKWPFWSLLLTTQTVPIYQIDTITWKNIFYHRWRSLQKGKMQRTLSCGPLCRYGIALCLTRNDLFTCLRLGWCLRIK